MRAFSSNVSQWFRDGRSEEAPLLYVDRNGTVCAADPWEEVISRCESPIEIALARAISKSGFYPMDQPYRFADVEERAVASGFTLFCWVQERMLRYRVDFLVSCYDSGTRNFSRLIVECDGHEYHSPFDSQRYDQQRDRDLRPHVTGILHLTGSEIYRDPMGASGRIVSLLISSAW